MLKYIALPNIYTIKKAHDISLQYVRGYLLSSCMVALFNIGFFDELLLHKNITIADFSRKKGVNLQILKALCKYLYAAGILKRGNGKYSLTPKGIILTKNARGPFDFICAYNPIFHNLEAILKNEKKYGVDVERKGEFVAKASAETERWIPFPVIEKIIQSGKYRSILDLGCGGAEFLIRLCKKIPQITAFGVDISSESIAYAKDRVKNEAMHERIHLEVGDIFKINKLKGAIRDVDVITSFFVLHEFLSLGREKVVSLLKMFKENFPRATLIICELYKKPPGVLKRTPTMITEHHLFHALSGQRLLNIREWESVISKAKYKVLKKINIPVASQSYFILR